MGKKHGPLQRARPKVGRGRQAYAHHPCRPVVCGALRPSVDLSPVLRDARILLASAASRPDVQQFAVLAQLGSFFMTALFFLLWTYRSYRHLSALSDRDLRFSPGWAVGWFFVPIMNLFRPYQVMKEMWRKSTPERVHPGPGSGRPVSPLLLELVASQQFARRSDGCQAHGSGGIGTLHVPDRYRRHPSLLGHLFLGARD